MFSKKLFNNNQNSSGGGTGGPTNWGSIGGDINNQTDLKNKLADKADKTELATKADKSELQTITQELDAKANVSQLNDKANKSELPAIATNNNVGLVKPDGTTITITSEGVISSVDSPTNWGSIGGDIDNQTDLKNKLADKANKSELPVIATNNNVGLVKPDGTSITITDDGTISSVGGEGTDVSITPLEYAETINLAIDHVYKLVATGNVTFVLPTVENPTTLPQILIQFKMDTVVTINLGTTSFFKKVAPDMSTAGIYNIIYEYDTNNNVWVVDAIAKGEVA